MPRGQKTAIRVLFASGIVCIFIATLRAAQITANTIKTHATMDAIIIGVCPSFAIIIRATRKNNKNPSNDGGVFSFHLPTIGSAPTRPKPKKDPNTHGSQNELATKPDSASITTTVHQDNESFGVARQ
ncbi:hypothetical protein PtrSN002B_009749 [Pyrenophora tritici-repentis]|uniref:Uncharacterized protein n=2 Tax=Pyrenophora tritici-repentis TaxID=45151 RepID=A0A316ZSK5_9PLEO|nr:uncharacterized protein PTRG_06588 [Pyrenophora tritici-repentis Pt-1C-BFP]KAI0572838.1 hypothetical protein Alg130_10338 [Pyrenophora tritici-repentis]EDU49508.1 conserved hypothetical protein [Pyrenophora tritici-repentis Pt-1C-BFP]KAI0572915.1 hypothetical protein Alg215_09494 [Pyrenophora tritici-repentis]KAI0604437.1 hypothetical protein TUN205_11315 [Pyrenophora tritici-repentis]KAI0618190.1 hypothetical protein TUN199_09814 [Pyrenophora tritici-repentis]